MAIAVQFKKGTYSAYSALTTKDNGTIYFCEDTKQVFVGSVEYANQMQGSGTSLPETAKMGDMFIHDGVLKIYVGSWIALQESISIEVTGNGNVITGATFANNKLTLTKGMTAEAAGTAESKVSAHNSDGSAHADIRTAVTNAQDAADNAQDAADAAQDAIDTHAAKTDNPHSVSASQVGAYTRAETDAKIQEKMIAGGAHSHDNKAELDLIATGDKAKWDEAASQAGTAVQGTAEGEKVLYKTGTNLKTTLSLNYKEDTKKIQLLGISDAVVAELDATAFIKDGMVSSVDFNNTTKKLKITFNTDAGQEDVEVDMTSLVDTYTAGNGIAISDNVVSIKVDTGSEEFLSVGDAGIKLSGVQDAIDAAKSAAISAAEADATSKANAAETAAKADATTKASTAKSEAISAAAEDATAKADAAESAAKAHAETKATAAENNAKAYADQKIADATLVWGTI